MKIQLDIPNDLMDKIAISRIEWKMKNKADTIVKILNDYYTKIPKY